MTPQAQIAGCATSRWPSARAGHHRFHVVYKAPIYAVVDGDEVVRVVVAGDCVEGPIVSECVSCGRSDVDGDHGPAAAAVGAVTRRWPGWQFGW